MTDFHSALPCKSKLQACSRYIASLVTNAVGDTVSGSTCSHSFAYSSGQCFLCHLRLPEIITGHAIEERIAIVKACGNNAEHNHLCYLHCCSPVLYVQRPTIINFMNLDNLLIFCCCNCLNVWCLKL